MISIYCLNIFLLACFVGFYVISTVTPALHAPLMSVTNAISSIIIIVSISIGIVENMTTPSFYLSLFAIFLASINIVGGFFITHRMLKMFENK